MARNNGQGASFNKGSAKYINILVTQFQYNLNLIIKSQRGNIKLFVKYDVNNHIFFK